MTDEKVQFLAQVPLFRKLKQRQLKKLAERIVQRVYNQGDVIVEQHHRGLGLFVIKSGTVKVIRIDSDGDEIELDTLTKGNFFGELAILTDEEVTRAARVQAIEDNTQCLVLPKLDFMDELEKEPEMAIEMLKVLAERFRRIIKGMEV